MPVEFRLHGLVLLENNLNDSLIQTHNVNLTPVGLTIISTLSYDEWVDLMKTLVRLETAFQFAIGDALIYGESQYGEKYSQAMDATGLSYQSLANMVWVSKHVPIQNRVTDVSWTHHRVIASIDKSDQKQMLEWARDNGMTAVDLQAHISGKQPPKLERVALPPGITENEAVAVLQAYADAIRESKGSSPDPEHDIDQATALSCVLCKTCPFRTDREEMK